VSFNLLSVICNVFDIQFTWFRYDLYLAKQQNSRLGSLLKIHQNTTNYYAPAQEALSDDVRLTSVWRLFVWRLSCTSSRWVGCAAGVARIGWSGPAQLAWFCCRPGWGFTILWCGMGTRSMEKLCGMAQEGVPKYLVVASRTASYFINVSVSTRDFHQRKKLGLPVLDTRTWHATSCACVNNQKT